MATSREAEVAVMALVSEMLDSDEDETAKDNNILLALL